MSVTRLRIADGRRSSTSDAKRRLRMESLEQRKLMAAYQSIPGVGFEGEGADMAYVDLNDNGIADVIAMAYDAPAGPNHFRYRIGYDVQEDGRALSWSGIKQGPALGHRGQGAGLAIADLDGDARPEVLFMAYDNPRGANTFRYVVGNDMNALGDVSSWSKMQVIEGVSHEADGAGLAIGNLDSDPRPDAIFMAYADHRSLNSFRYRLGYNLDTSGRAQYFRSTVVVKGLGAEGDSAGIALGNPDADPRPDAVFMAYDDPTGQNEFRLKIGYNLSADGYAQRFSSPIEVDGVGHRGDGAGISLHDIDRDGTDEFVTMAYDDPPLSSRSAKHVKHSQRSLAGKFARVFYSAAEAVPITVFDARRWLVFLASTYACYRYSKRSIRPFRRRGSLLNPW